MKSQNMRAKLNINGLPTIGLVGVMASTSPTLGAGPNQLTVSLNVASYPSTQPGWAYIAGGCNSGVSEEDAFIPGPGSITLDTMGVRPIGCSGGNQAIWGGASPTGIDRGSVRLEATFRVLNSEVVTYHYGMYIGARVGDTRMSIGLSTDTIQFDDLSTLPFDATGWHTYVLETDSESTEFTVSIDGAVIGVRPKSGPGLAGPEVSVGDGTGSANALAEIASCSAHFTFACAEADLVAPYGLLDLTDVTTFASAFLEGNPLGDLDGNGLYDLNDVGVFVSSFTLGCP